METEESRTDAIGPGEKSFDTIYFETKRTKTEKIDALASIGRFSVDVGLKVIAYFSNGHVKKCNLIVLLMFNRKTDIRMLGVEILKKRAAWEESLNITKVSST